MSEIEERPCCRDNLNRWRCCVAAFARCHRNGRKKGAGVVEWPAKRGKSYTYFTHVGAREDGIMTCRDSNKAVVIHHSAGVCK